jgi:hypothetical protein
LRPRRLARLRSLRSGACTGKRIETSMADTPRTLAEVAAFIDAFEARRLPKDRWTHEGHLAAGLWYVWHFGATQALERLRVAIRDHNTSVGTANTDSSGYHETITRLYVEAIDRLRSASQGCTFEEILAKLLSSPMAKSEWPLSFYSRDRLFSVHARREWVPPDEPPGGQPVA